MKLLKIRASGIPLFKDTCEIDFIARQRVTADDAEAMSTVFTAGMQAFVQNNVLAMIGINASGKTTVLKLITFVCRMLNNEPLNRIDCAEVLTAWQRISMPHSKHIFLRTAMHLAIRLTERQLTSLKR